MVQQRPVPAQSTRGAFTLIELLVVIAIIAVLIGILLPALPGIRDTARKTACKANLRSVGQVLELYKDDNERKFPVARYMPRPWLSGSEDPGFNDAIEDVLEPYSSVYRCPGDNEVIWSETYEDDSGAEKECGMSYTYISGLSGQRYEQSFFVEFLDQQPHETPVMYDYDGGTFETEDGRMVTADFFHAERNILFVDGHVDRLETVEPPRGDEG